MTKTQTGFLLFFVLALLAGAALFVISSQTASKENPELKGAYCGELKNPEVYSKNNLEHYRVLIEGKGGWIFRTENDFRKDFSINERTINYLVDFQSALGRKGMNLVIIYPPVRGMIHADKVQKSDRRNLGMDKLNAVWESYERSLDRLRGAGINVVGLSRNEVGENFFYKRNHHWTAEGAKKTAQKTALLVKMLPQYQNVPKKEYKTIEKGPGVIESTFEKAFRKVCDSDLPEEQIIEYVTMQEYEAVSEDELLGNQGNQEPQIVLLGTSNSIDDTSKANFTGFLKENLSADIDNRAVVGAGIDTSVVSFLNSDKYREGNADIVIWEIPGYYDLNIMDDKLFRQIIPGAYGPCQNDAVLTGQLSDIVKGKKTLFDFADGSAEEVNGFGHRPYLHMTFSKPVENKFLLHFIYEDNEQKKQEFDRDSRYPEDRDFYILFPENEPLENLEKITLDFPRMMEPKKLEAEVCNLPVKKTGSKAAASSPEDESKT